MNLPPGFERPGASVYVYGLLVFIVLLGLSFSIGGFP